MTGLDPATLLIASCATTFLVSVQFLVSWRQSPDAPCLGLWSLAHFIGSVASVGLALRGVIPDWLSVGVANSAMIAAYGLIWSGVRSFERRPYPLAIGLAGGLAWALLCQIPAFYESIAMRVAFASAIAASYCFDGAWCFWRGRGEPLASRRAAIGLLAVYGLCYLIRVPAAFLAPLPTQQTPLASPWVAILCLAAMLFSIASAFTFIGLVKERAESKQRLAAGTDSLTGAPNRRAFLETADALLAAPSDKALLLFDLDRFKAINDRFGHEVGDAVIVGFCAVAINMLPEQAVFARLGGEEFACLLVGTTPDAAIQAAERVRRTFAGISLPEMPELHLSVSIGVAQATPDCDFDRLLRRADTALYAAKKSGRDRVEMAEYVLRAA
ncbi:sensor domain-containing diguanylate cyclase [Methylobacterium sp. J-076]|uniref:GGDEF domain-containing protein n=1 Tax=Methylobacterium sp. J-076 TaxID=2836655 RepID=UPI001FB937FC|nr:GGDEF domain-containing protein [Methylobacterium sp. J-076]MCJ2015348.1 GGDEF domain-containing protein [Methylobacterium sp. J-076]